MLSFLSDDYKYIVLALYLFCNIENAFVNFSFSPIVKSLKFSYNITDFDIYYLSICYSIFYLFANFPANWVIERKGTKFSMIIFSVCQIVCCLLRLFINDSLVVLHIGQTIAAISCPFVNNVVSKISVNWFEPKKRIISTTVMTSSFMLGTGLAFLLSVFFVSDPEINPDPLSQKEQILHYLTSGLFLSIIVFLLVLIFFREKPENPICLISEFPRENYCESIKLMAKNKNFLFLCGGFSLQTSNFSLFVVYLHFIISPFGYSETQMAYIGSLVNFCCFLGKLSVVFLFNYFLSFKKTLFYICLCLLVSTAGFLLSLTLNLSVLIFIFSCFFGFFLQMYWSPSYEFACELIFPVGEANANGGLILSGCLINVVFGFIFSKIFNLEQDIWAPFAFSYFLISTASSTLLFQCIQEDLKREKKEIELKAKHLEIKIPLLED